MMTNVFTITVALSCVWTSSSTSCTSDETSLMQLDTKLHSHKQPADLPAMWQTHEFLHFFKAEDLKESLSKGWAKDCPGTTFKKSSYKDTGDFPNCKSAAKDKSCNACIESSWSGNEGAGNKCCAAMNIETSQKSPLCGICARFNTDTSKGFGLNGDGEAEQIRYKSCAQYYCAAQTMEPDLANIAKYCTPKGALEHPNMVAIVANNPRKPDLAKFVRDFAEKFQTLMNVSGGNLTGTATSSNMGNCIFEEEVGKTFRRFPTKSGPYGGDADLAGILATQAKEKKTLVSAVFFFDLESEAHRQDIIALKKIMQFTGVPYAHNAADGETLLNKLLH